MHLGVDLGCTCRSHYALLIYIFFGTAYESSSSDEEETATAAAEEGKSGEHEVELDIDLTAQANARKYYDKKKSAALKEQKTLKSVTTAIKSAEK